MFAGIFRGEIIVSLCASIAYEYADVYIGTGLGAVDPEEVREPPPLPTTPSFPEGESYGGDLLWDEDTPPHRLERLFSRILKPADIRDEHAIALNICSSARRPIEVCALDVFWFATPHSQWLLRCGQKLSFPHQCYYKPPCGLVVNAHQSVPSTERTG